MLKDFAFAEFRVIGFRGFATTNFTKYLRFTKLKLMILSKLSFAPKHPATAKIDIFNLMEVCNLKSTGSFNALTKIKTAFIF